MPSPADLAAAARARASEETSGLRGSDLSSAESSAETPEGADAGLPTVPPAKRRRRRKRSGAEGVGDTAPRTPSASTPPQAPRRIPCAREGCVRYTPDGAASEHTTCCLLCSLVMSQLERAQRICEVTQDASHWLAAVGLSDALTEYFRSETRVRGQSMNRGLTAQEWQAIRRVTPPTGVTPAPGA
ncbi:hypothetical protein MPSYJ_28760 [Mycolicibacterium psychrotolerans]|uniref:Uncharacterized protein n=1 Tax=Mycolicibacterium psychrotolerans TaxID=216929 RepID=A0A7I7MB41_9MYCO|nr:hypothetical protein MPSYJ_28760 [Mycolicibacterium psychrotolerans]